MTPKEYNVTEKVSGALGLKMTPLIVLMLLNLVLFLVTFFGESLLGYLGVVPNLFAERPWTLLTGMFIYLNFWQYLVVMIPLFFIGNLLLKDIGNLNFLLVYFGGGVLGGTLFILLAMVMPGRANDLMLGSGSTIFAVGMVLIFLVGRQPVKMMLIPAPIPLYAVVIFFFVIVLVSFGPRVSWEAHLGGLLFGAVAGYFIRRRRIAWQW